MITRSPAAVTRARCRASLDVLAHGTPRRVLHRDPFEVGSFAQRRLFFVGQTQRHRHDVMVSNRYQIVTMRS
ncbi:MAG: hypothetical protein QM733_17075 [Ilumatobacteraceae bacterium]